MNAFPHRVYASPAEVINTELALKDGPRILSAIENYLKTPYSFPKMDQIAIPDFNAGAMENWGLVTYREEALLWNETLHPYQRKLRIVTVIAHEFGHQWFGNAVSPKWWSYLWLNEGANNKQTTNFVINENFLIVIDNIAGFANLFEHIGTDLVRLIHTYTAYGQLKVIHKSVTFVLSWFH